MRIDVVKNLFLFVGALVVFAPACPVLASEVSEKFQSKLESGCLKVDTPEVCSCYAKAVTKRYDDGQLAVIFQLLKNKEANQMFLVTHSVEGRACKASS